MTIEPVAPLGHNNPPVTLPVDADYLAEMQRKYPEIDARIADWEEAFKTFQDEKGNPIDLQTDQEDIAAALQDLLGQVSKDSKVWKDSYMKQEKKPLNGLLKIVGNFFTIRIEKAETLYDRFKPAHDTFMRRKADKARQEAEEAAAAQREAARAAREAAEQARREQEEAEARAAEERRKEQEAREAAERAAKEKAEAEARALAAKEEERRQAEERKARERAEKDANVTALREIRELMKEAEKLNSAADAGEINADEEARLNDLTKPGGIIGELARPVAASMLLDDDQKIRITDVRTRLGQMRDTLSACLNKREQKRRAAEAAKEEERLAAEAEIRRKQREEDERAAESAKKRREEEELAAKVAADRRRAEEAAARAARDAAREHEADAKDAGKDVKQAASEADRSANRADRIETRLEKSTEADLSRTRGDLGTVGSLGRHWVHTVTDEEALRAAIRTSILASNIAEYAKFATLIDQLNYEALNGAVFRFMRIHQAGWKGLKRVDNELPGVVFTYDVDGNIR